MQDRDTYKSSITYDTAVGRALLFKVLEESPASISVVDLDGVIVYVNQRFCEVTGYAPTEVIGQHTRILKSGDTPVERYRTLWETVLSGREWVGEFHNRRKDGSLYWERATISPIQHEQGAIEYFAKISVDFTREHDLEESLHSQYMLFSRITENMSDVVAMLDADGRYQYVTPSSARVLGYTPEALKGHPVFDFIAPEQRERHIAMFKAALTGKRGHIETLFGHKNGHFIWLESAAQTLLDANGRSTGMLLASRDITRRKKTETELIQTNKKLERHTELLRGSLNEMEDLTLELHEAKARHERLVRATNGFVFSVDLENGVVVDATNYPGCEQVTGYTAEEYAEDVDLWGRMIHEDDKVEVLRQINALKTGAPTVVLEHRITHRDGRTRWLKNTSVARHGEEGKLVGYDGLITDITGLKKAEADRLALTEQLRDMALRDPLTDLMNRRGFEEELKRLWDLAVRHEFPMGLLALDIDHFKTLNDSYGHVLGDRVLGECSRLIKSCVRDSDVVCRFGGDEMTVILPWTDALATRTVADRILEAFRERVFCKGDHDLCVTVSIGTSTVLPKTGHSPERFIAHADKALYRAKQIGRNRVCVAEEPTSAVIAGMDTETAAPEVVDNHAGSVLVIDDDPSIRRLSERMLEKEGYVVRVAETSAEAVAMLERERGLIDVALVDLNLGMESGIDLIRKIHQLDDTVIRIVITGQVSVDSAVESLRSGAYDFVQKPFSGAQVKASLTRAVQYRRLLLDNRRYQMHLENMVREKSAAHSRALDRLRESFQFALEAMAGMLDAREEKTGAHSQRVAVITAVLARDLHVPPEDMETLEVGALLHDIGKVAIPDAILLKPGPLTDEERLIMQRHPQIGYDLIRRNAELQGAADIVLQHQERYDGTGYPQGLKGDAICFGARIFTVADAYDAMRDERHYSDSMTAEQALEEVLQHGGTQFDPVVVEALVRCQKEIEAAANWPGSTYEHNPS